MSDIGKVSPHDLFVGLIGKAISTGKRVTVKETARNNTFFAGRISAFIYSAAMLADQMYGCNFDDVKHRIRREVEDVHLHWSDEELRDAGYVGNQATIIADRVLV
jgi:hypothetical protein